MVSWKGVEDISNPCGTMNPHILVVVWVGCIVFIIIVTTMEQHLFVFSFAIEGATVKVYTFYAPVS